MKPGVIQEEKQEVKNRFLFKIIVQTEQRE